PSFSTLSLHDALPIFVTFRWTEKLQPLFARDLGDGPFRGQIASQNTDVPRFLDRVLEGLNDLLTRFQSFEVSQVLGERLACHCQDRKSTRLNSSHVAI